MAQLSEDELFQDSFNEWLTAHGVELDDQLDSGEFRANINLNQLKAAIAIFARQYAEEREIHELRIAIRIVGRNGDVHRIRELLNERWDRLTSPLPNTEKEK